MTDPNESRVPIVFVPTGEVRKACDGEWYYDEYEEHPFLSGQTTHFEAPILRRVDGKVVEELVKHLKRMTSQMYLALESEHDLFDEEKEEVAVYVEDSRRALAAWNAAIAGEGGEA